MPVRIKITAASIVLYGSLNDSLTAKAIADVLPLKALVQTWGEEIYFSIPVERPLEEDAKSVVEPGEIGYWPRGKALCIFFGPTPISKGNEIRPASAVNIVGRVEKNVDLLKNIKEGEPIVVEKVS